MTDEKATTDAPASHGANVMWQPIETAPKETPVIIQTEQGRVFLARLEFGAAFDDSESPIWAWQAEHEHVSPDCWSADVCWAQNIDDEPSDPPARWLPLPTSDTAAGGTSVGVSGYVADKPYGWAVEYEPGKYLTDDDTTTCVWRSKAKADQQARWQKDFDDAWDGIRVVPVFIGNPAT